jgi:hypothetical protein
MNPDTDHVSQLLDEPGVITDGGVCQISVKILAIIVDTAGVKNYYIVCLIIIHILNA